LFQLSLPSSKSTFHALSEFPAYGDADQKLDAIADALDGGREPPT